VVRARLQQRFDAGRALVYGSSWEALVLTWQREGIVGFYKGLLPSLLRTMPQSAITLTVYERLLQLLQSEAGGAEAAGGHGPDGQQQQQQRRPQKAGAAGRDAAGSSNSSGGGSGRSSGNASNRSLGDGAQPLVMPSTAPNSRV
jgi:solute carrier family 25 folate transporter 32